MSRIALLDVNVLIALFSPDHVHHDIAHDWFTDHHHFGWATCPLTENAFVRLVTNPALGLPLQRPVEVIDRLRRLCSSPGHHYWPDSVSFTDDGRFDVKLMRGHRQVTDIYLLGLATARDGALTTFDSTIPIAAVKGAEAHHLQLIAPCPE